MPTKPAAHKRRDKRMTGRHFSAVAKAVRTAHEARLRDIGADERGGYHVAMEAVAYRDAVIDALCNELAPLAGLPLHGDHPTPTLFDEARFRHDCGQRHVARVL